MSTKTWTSKADFDTGTLSSVVDYRNNDLQLSCTWSAGGNLNTATQELAGCGTQTAGLGFGGYTTDYSNKTEEYNGSSWCTGGNLNTARYALGGCGTQIAGLCFGGGTAIFNEVTTTARWTGASFTPPLEDLKDVLWYPTGGSGYYTTQPQDVECPHNRWYRLEVTLTEGSTPEVTEINQNYGEDC